MRIGAFLAATVLLATPSVHAAVLTFDLTREFSGGTPPSGASPWVRVSFDDGGSAGSVTLKVESLTLAGSEFLTDLYLNLDPALDADDLTFGTQSQTGTFALPANSAATNGINGNAAGTFDILIGFDNSPPANRFGGGDAYTVVLGGLPSMTAASFDFLSVGGGQGPLKVAGHVQGIGPNAASSGKITIPEPAALAATAALVGVAGFRRRR